DDFEYDRVNNEEEYVQKLTQVTAETIEFVNSRQGKRPGRWGRIKSGVTRWWRNRTSSKKGNAGRVNNFLTLNNVSAARLKDLLEDMNYHPGKFDVREINAFRYSALFQNLTVLAEKWRRQN